MAKKHPDDASIIRYRIKSPEVWTAIRGEWEAGGYMAELARRFDVSASTVSRRRDREGWSRSTAMTRLTAPSPGPIDALTIAESALARSVEALAQGRASEAMALIKAGDAVGAFADFVARLRQGAPRHDAREAPGAGGPGADASSPSARLPREGGAETKVAADVGGARP